MSKVSVGDVIGRLNVLAQAPSRPGTKGKRSYFTCRCECGTVKQIREDTLKFKTRSCGCLTREVAAAKAKLTKELGGHVTHGQSSSSTYTSWRSMKERCLNPKNRTYQAYGAKGITIHPDWLSYEAFYADMGDRPEGTTIDRIDNTKGYGPGNCRWADKSEQMTNRSNSLRYMYRGQELTLRQLSGMSKISITTIAQRIHKLRWSVEDAVELQINSRAPKKSTHCLAMRLYPLIEKSEREEHEKPT